MVHPDKFVLVTYQPLKSDRRPYKKVHHHIMSEVALLALAGRALIHGATRVSPKVLRLVRP